ncbi:hypothetical protein V5799_006389 [Amblyomma americanum]|uniref:Trafficking protein particle complex subunit 11 domain-containing protein n=1 Tax=Amblyomma americanum TaxID=6943 RepID=A0AAQ4DWJ1_AMBAM
MQLSVLHSQHLDTKNYLQSLITHLICIWPNYANRPSFFFPPRLETAFLEITQGYYLNECKRVKAHKDFVNKNTHQQLLIRHQFKIAFLHELKQDPGIAIRHYKQAYVDLLELKTTDANILEVKTVAGILNYKLCQLAFMQNIPLDAIHQFRRHVDLFKDRVGNPRLAFEHSAWMSKQFSHFGDLFEEAVGFGLTAIQTQHPGFYFQQAANHALARKEQAARLCRVSSPSQPKSIGSRLSKARSNAQS